MIKCPEVAVLESRGWTAEVTAHVAGCGSCKLVMELIEERSQAAASRDRRVECAKFEALLAVRVAGGIGTIAAGMLDEHLEECDECRAIAETMAPTNDRTEDQTTLVTIERSAYALGPEVARGGMGRIVSARDLRIGRPVAVKELLANTSTQAARFEREARVTARLQHPGIVPIYEIGRWANGTPFYSMRMVAGRTLRAELADRKTVAARLALLTAVITATEAVAFAHANRVIHRDLTPSNIMVGEYGETVVIDWGLAKNFGDETLPTADDDVVDAGPYRRDPSAPDDLTVDGAIIGTASYMPPEQAAGDRVDARADVYALGAVLYHVLVGQAPYRGRNEAVLAAVTAGPPPKLSVEAPRDLVSIVEKAMARDPADRYPSARELAAELTAFQAGRLVEAHRYSRGELLRRWLRRRRGLVIAALASVVALVVAGSVAIVGIVRERNRAEAGEAEATQQRGSAETAAAELLEDSGRQELLAGHPTRAAVWLSASYSAGNQRPALRFLLGRAMSSLEARERELHCDSPLGRPDVSPDDKTVLASCGSTVQIWRVEDGAVVMSLSAPGIRWRQAAFSHDGHAVVAWNDDGNVEVWDSSTGARRISLVGHRGRIHYASFSQDDRLIVTSGGDRTVRVWDATTGSELRRLDISSAAPGAVRAGFLGPGHAIVSTSSDGMISLWDGDTGSLARSLSTGSLVVSADLTGSTLERGVACGADGVARMWDLVHGRVVGAFAGHADVIWTCKLSPDRTRLLTTSGDGTAKVWDLASGRLVQTVAPGGVVNAGAFSRDGRRIVTGVLGSGVQVWDVATGALLGADDGANVESDTVRLVGDRIFAADGSTLRIWNRLGDRAEVRRFSAPAGTEIFTSGDFSGERVVLSSPTGLGVWDVEHDRAVPHLLVRLPAASTRTRLAARSAGGIAVIGLADGATVAALPVVGEITEVEVSADGRRVLANGPTGVTIWDVERSAELARWSPEWHVGNLSDDGELVVAWREPSDRDPYAEIWRLSPPARIQTLAIGRDVIWNAQFSRDHKRLIAKQGAQLVGAVSIWDLSTGQRTRVIPGALTLRLDATGDQAAISFAHRHEIWRVKDAVRLATIPDLGYVTTVDTTADGAFVGVVEAVTATYDLLDASDGRVLESMPAPRVSVVSAEGYNIGTGLITFASDSSRAMISTRPNAMWFTVAREQRTPVEVAQIVALRARWRLEGTKLIERAEARLTLKGVATRLGKPVAGATIHVVVAADFFTGGFTVLSAADGSFVVDDLPSAPVTVDAASIALGAFARPRPVTLAGTNDRVVIEMDLAGSVEGRVVDATGAPVADIEVFANCQALGDSGNAVTDRDGRFTIGALAGGGAYELKLHHFQTIVAADAPSVTVRDGNDHVRGVEIRVR